MVDVFLTASAEADIEEISRYSLHRWGSDKALEYLAAIENTLSLLATNTQAGQSREELHTGLFSFPFQSHIIYYIPEKTHITIIRVLHKSMDALQHL